MRIKPVIDVQRLIKSYKIYSRPFDMLLNIFTKRDRYKTFTALENISFKVNRGEVVGIIGRNGAGKSTLLRILAGTLDYTSGTCRVNGKISAILELGTGFHDEYSGRDNIYMGGMCLGMSSGEIDGKIDGIIKFSELSQVIDQPIKTYSSGMKARLAFSVAMSVNPDILIIDEVLATGDAVFVAKCIRRISDLCKSGATVILVTHSTDLVRRLCNRCIYLKDGMVHMDGDVENVSSLYDIDMLEIASESIKLVQTGATGGDGPVHIRSLTILNRNEESTNGFFQHDMMRIRITFFCEHDVENPAIWLKFTRTDGVIAATWFSHEPDYIDVGFLRKGHHEFDLIMDDLMLGDGNFDITLAIFKKRDNKADTAFYPDPMSIWERTHQIAVKRKHRPLVSIFDHPVRIKKRSSENLGDKGVK